MVHDTHAPPNPPEPAKAVTGAPLQDWSQLDPKRWLALAVILIAAFMDLLDATIVNVAIPSMQDNLHARYSDIEWIVAAYALAFAALLITGGRLGDIFGRKLVFMTGVLGFTVASVLCGLSQTPGELIGARFLQGAMAGLMVPQVLSIIHVSFPPAERGKVFGMFGGIVGSASVFGPILGGLLVQWNVHNLHWRPIFLVNLPVGLLALIPAYFVIRESKSPSAPRLDLFGMVLAIAAVVLIVYPLTEGRSDGWPLSGYLMMAAAAPVLHVFVLYERRRTARVGSPLVVLSLFRQRSFDAGLSVWLIFNVALSGFFLVWTLYMQIGLGWTPIHSGLTGILFAFGAAPAAGASVQALTPKFGRKVLMAGALLNAAGFAVFIYMAAHYGTRITTWEMIAPLLISGVGFGLVVAPITDLVLSDVPTADAGSASGLFSTVQQVGAALGIALIGVIFFSQLNTQSHKAVDAVAPKLRTTLSAAGLPGPAVDGLVADFGTCIHDRAAATDPTATPASCQKNPQQMGVDAATASKVTAILTSSGQSAAGEDFWRGFGVTLVWMIGDLFLVFLGMFALPKVLREIDPAEKTWA